MSYTTQESADAVVLTPSAPPNAAVIWLHGLGADGFDFVPIVDELRLPAPLAVRFVFPQAQPRPVTINNGYVMRAWYDIKGFAPNRVEDEAGIRDSVRIVQQYIDREVAAGIGADHIVIAGFSQGGAVALNAGLRYSQRLAGIMGLSTYLPLPESIAAEAAAANRSTPILLCHGLRDPVLPIQMGMAARDLLQGQGHVVEWRSYPMEHQVCMEEIVDISAWLQARLPRNI